MHRENPGMIASGRAVLARKALLAALMGGTLALGGCGGRLQQFTGSLGDATRAGTPERSTDALADLARRYDAKPGEKRASLDYAHALRANGQHHQAVAVLQRASITSVGDREVAAAYGKALADIGRLDQANQVLAQAHTEDRPNWRVLSTMGSIADQTGDHARARDLYHRALQIAPNEPSVLNNLGLSYILTKELALAESTLRKAAEAPGADVRIRANLDLALRLQGKAGAPERPAPQPVAPVAMAPASAPAGVRSATTTASSPAPGRIRGPFTTSLLQPTEPRAKAESVKVESADQ